MPICLTCQKEFIKVSGCQKRCVVCSPHANAYIDGIGAAELKAKEAADRSGNPRIWTREEYSQSFLESLIPRRG